MKFVYQLGQDIANQEQQTNAVYHIGRAEIVPVIRVISEPVSVPTNIYIEITFNVKITPSWWDRVTTWLKNRLGKLL